MRFNALVALAILSACGNDTPAGLEPTGRFRFVDLIGDLQKQPVSVYLDGSRFGGLDYGGSLPFWLPPPSTALYKSIGEGEHSLTLKWIRDTTVIVGLYTFTVEADQDRTLYATTGGFTLSETVDLNVSFAPGSLRMRIVNQSLVAGPIDVFITSQTADLTTATANATGVFPRTASGYFEIPPGTYRVRAVRAGAAPAARAANVVMNLSDQPWERGARSIVVADVTSGGGALFSTGVVLRDQ